ncbi:helix-turn-helix domain-containing protein [Clostridium perfringens]|uniref:helix-turn-helix domain-containing protein n=1 Tax=Clostridium perfringens TaxID=1502 RepID=UPI0039EC2957
MANKEVSKNYYNIPSKLNNDELLVYYRLCENANFTLEEFRDKKRFECFGSKRTLSEDTGLGDKKVLVSLKNLEEKGYIELIKKGKPPKTPSKYKLVYAEKIKNREPFESVENKGVKRVCEPLEEPLKEPLKEPPSKDISKDNSKDINNIYSPLENELYYDEVNKNLEKDLIKRINSKYPKDIIKEEFEKLKYKGFSELDLLKELDKNLKSKSKVKKDKYSEDSKEYKLSILLRDLILRRDENSRCKNADMQKWSKEIDLLHRKDNRSYENIEKIIRWCQQDTFWKANILSTHKLREKFDSLYQKAFCENKSYNRNNFKNDSSERSNDTDGECWYFKDSL